MTTPETIAEPPTTADTVATGKKSESDDGGDKMVGDMEGGVKIGERTGEGDTVTETQVRENTEVEAEGGDKEGEEETAPMEQTDEQN